MKSETYPMPDCIQRKGWESIKVLNLSLHGRKPILSRLF